MKIVVLYNRSSGRGRGLGAAGGAATGLRADGHEVELVEVGPSVLEADRAGLLARGVGGAGALVIVGGDGTVHHLIDVAVASGTPIYQVPLGTENLFARQFGMDGRPATLRRALQKRDIARVDVGRCNGRAFLLMCSLGPDASVIHRLAKARRRALGHLAYVVPTLAELAAPHFPRLNVVVDGECLVPGRQGLVVVANSRQYAVRVDPAVLASMTDGELDVVFFPCRWAAQVVWWAARSRLRCHVGGVAGEAGGGRGSALYRRGREVRIESVEGAAPYQLDGEAAGYSNGAAPGGDVGEVPGLRITVDPGALGVLRP